MRDAGEYYGRIYMWTIRTWLIKALVTLWACPIFDMVTAKSSRGALRMFGPMTIESEWEVIWLSSS